MYPRIHLELVADSLGLAEHSLGTAGLGDRTNFVGTQSLVVLLWYVSRVKDGGYCRLGWAYLSLTQNRRVVLQHKIYIF
jgi:hypothetical protein